MRSATSERNPAARPLEGHPARGADGYTRRIDCDGMGERGGYGARGGRGPGARDDDRWERARGTRH